MITILLLICIVGGIVWWVGYKNIKESEKNKLFNAAKKLQETVVDVADVNNDGTVNMKDAVAAATKVQEKAKKVVKGAKKITPKKKPAKKK